MTATELQEELVNRSFKNCIETNGISFYKGHIAVYIECNYIRDNKIVPVLDYEYNCHYGSQDYTTKNSSFSTKDASEALNWVDTFTPEPNKQRRVEIKLVYEGYSEVDEVKRYLSSCFGTKSKLVDMDIISDREIE